jgi:HD superfamily phosphohydrolase
MPVAHEYRRQRVRDPVHNLIEFRANEFDSVMWDVIRTPGFQRLRRIKQLGFSDLVYPGAAHSRLSHSIGVFHVARRLMTIIEDHLGESGFQETRAKAALAAALLHDVGHGPFSHAFEDVGHRLKLRMASHEMVSDALIRDDGKDGIAPRLNKISSGFANDVAEIVKRKGAEDIYGAVVSSQFDADRLDYMQRDRLMTGTHLGAIDFEWLTDNLEVGDIPYGVDERQVGTLKTFVVGPKARHAAEAYVLGLFQLYPTVYYHKATRGAEKLFSELLYRVIEHLLNDGRALTGLPATHPLVAFAMAPERVENVRRLDDTVIFGALSLFDDKDTCPIVAELARRLRDRNLYKAYDVRESLADAYAGLVAVQKKGSEQGSLFAESALPDDIERSIDIACVRVADAVEDWMMQNAGGCPPILTDRGEREPYKQFSESKGPLNQIMIRSRSGALMDLGVHSVVVRAMPTFKHFRIYASREHPKATDFVKDLIRREIENVGEG